jgi:hypothetical protein
MQLVFRLLSILVVCLIAIALSSVPAQAQCVLYGIELSPGWGVPGTEVTVHGHDFHEDTLVDIYYGGTGEDDRVATNRTDDDGGFTITFTVPEGCTGYYQVLADVGYDTVDAYFIVKPGLRVSPEEGPVATTVTVEGRGFAKQEDGIELIYYLNGDHETIKSRIKANASGSWETSFQIPPSTSGEHKLDAQGPVSKLYEVRDAIFRVTAEISIDKSSGSVGESITMTGSRFGPYEQGIQILFDGQPVVTSIKADSQGGWEETFDVPSMPTGDYTVTAEGEQTPKEDIVELNFQIEPDILLSTDKGYVGMNLTVTGDGFATDKSVSIMYDGSQVTTATTDDEGNFEARFAVPQSEHGEHKITIGYSTGDIASTMFILESVHPNTPQLISPSDRSRMGLKGSVTPTFEWSKVSDDSGVFYDLQIATSADINGTGEFSDPLVSVVGLVGTNYTLPETEALPNGAYYWIVQAVDGAENGSGWTTARSFRVGLLPLWAFIAIIVAAVVLIGALIRSLVIRRSIYYDRW